MYNDDNNSNSRVVITILTMVIVVKVVITILTIAIVVRVVITILTIEIVIRLIRIQQLIISSLALE